MKTTEIIEAETRAEQHLNSEPIETAIGDAIADLTIYAYERNVSIAECIVNGVAHALATYMEGEEAHVADEHLRELLFPFTGERQFADYIGERAIGLAGLEGHTTVPEWGT